MDNSASTKLLGTQTMPHMEAFDFFIATSISGEGHGNFFFKIMYGPSDDMYTFISILDLATFLTVFHFPSF